ncbi:MAG TPA: hypothetical protein VK993_02110 [Chthoniobacterales bacterium]|nr:hypothetical protein [Chthoniobacterales bacterium]
MKFLLTLVTLLALVGSAIAAPKAREGRTIEQINVIPTRVLKRAISPKFFETLRISPIDGHVVVRAELVGTKLFGARIAKSDLGGSFDALAIERAKEVRLLRHYKVDSQLPSSPVLLHLLIYKIADGTMALSFVNLASPGDEQLDYFGCTKLKVLQNDGRWVEVKGPSSLQDKGVMVRATGVKNNLEAIAILERIPGSR